MKTATFVILLACGFSLPAAWADNSKGIAAFERQDFAQSADLLRRPAESGDPEAQYYLGFALRNVALDNTDDVSKTVAILKESHGWFGKAATQGYAPAQHQFGWTFDRGLGVLPDYDQALMWTQKAYVAGDEGARLQLEGWYEDGHIVAPSWQMAQDLRKAAKPVTSVPGVVSESELAQIKDSLRATGKRMNSMDPNRDAKRLAAAEAGDGQQASIIASAALRETPEDCASALKWYRRAGDSGYPFGYTQLGLLHLQGHCVKQDFTEARKLFSAAAEGGEPWALLRLGRMETFGHGQAPDYAAAYLHLSLLKLTSNRFREDMAPMLVYTRARLKPEQVSQINAAAAAQAPAIIEKARKR